MINHHPKSELINAFIDGELPTALSVIVASHIELCTTCSQKAKKINQHQAANVFADNAFEIDDSACNAPLEEDAFNNMFKAITNNNEQAAPAQRQETHITIKNTDYVLPQALNNIERANWFKLGKLSRANLNSSENEIHSHLIHIEAGGEIPPHTHKGYEVTLILSGDFYDELGQYGKGDFMWLDKTHTHQPRTKNGCLCLTVANDALHFTQGVGKILNPIGSLIY